jgi:hypothetical protein
VPLDPTTTQAVQSWINSHCGTLSCSACGSAGPWNVGDLVAVPNVPTPLTGAHLNLSGMSASLFVPLLCSRCAHARFFSAAMMGIYMPPGPQPTGPAPPSP